jgi:uncharacterized membrane protein
MIGTILFVGLVVLIQMLGQVCLKRGLNSLPHSVMRRPSDLLGFIVMVFRLRFVQVALVLWATWYVLYISVLHKFDISKSFPLNSLDLLLILLVSKFYLRETIPWQRWAGATLICVGVVLVASS